MASYTIRLDVLKLSLAHRDGTSMRILPRPIFSDVTSIHAPLDEYYRSHPAVSMYFSQFPASLDVEADFECAREFLMLHSNAIGTFGNYRNFVERLLLWSWIYGEKSVRNLTSSDIRQFVRFNESPPSHWVGDSPRRRFVKEDDFSVFNENWRPMGFWPSKAERKAAIGPIHQIEPLLPTSSVSNIGQLLRICSSFYNYLITEERAQANPVYRIRKTGPQVVNAARLTGRGLTNDQWLFVIDVAEMMANENPKHERTLFIISAVFSMYLRGSDLSIKSYGTPTMGAFVNCNGLWWFELVDRYDAVKKISVKPDFIPYLIRYRTSRDLPPLPPPGDPTPLLTTDHGRAGLTDRHIRKVVQRVFDRTYLEMKLLGKSDDECVALRSASVAWLRDTGARIDAQNRDPVSLQMDLRHMSLASTLDRYYTARSVDQSAGIRRGELRPKRS